jgi:hypothetical protein
MLLPAALSNTSHSGDVLFKQTSLSLLSAPDKIRIKTVNKKKAFDGLSKAFCANNLNSFSYKTGREGGI